MHPDSFLLEEILLNILVGLSLWASLQWPIWVQRDEKLEEWSHSMTQLDLIMQVNANYEPQQHSAAALYSPLLCSSYWSWSLCSFSLLRGMFFFFFFLSDRANICNIVQLLKLFWSYTEMRNFGGIPRVQYFRAGWEKHCNCPCMSANISYDACCPETMKKCNDYKTQKQRISHASWMFATPIVYSTNLFPSYILRINSDSHKQGTPWLCRY